MAFEDLVADDLAALPSFKLAEVSDIEDDAPDETAKKRRRALLGAGLSAAALGGIGYLGYKGFDAAVGAGKALDAQVNPADTTSLKQQLSSIGSTVGELSGGMAPWIFGARFAKDSVRTGLNRSDILALAEYLRTPDENLTPATKWKEFWRGVSLVMPPNKTKEYEPLRAMLNRYGGKDNSQNLRTQFADALTAAARGQGPANQASLVTARDIMERAPGGIYEENTRTGVRQYRLDSALSSQRGRDIDVRLENVRENFLTRNGVDRVVDRPLLEDGGAPRARSMRQGELDRTIDTLLGHRGRGEAALNELRLGIPAAGNEPTVVQGEIANRLLASVGRQMGLAVEPPARGNRNAPQPPPVNAIATNADVAPTAARTAETLRALQVALHGGGPGKAPFGTSAEWHVPGAQLRNPLATSLPRAAGVAVSSLGIAALGGALMSDARQSGSPAQQATEAVNAVK